MEVAATSVPSDAATAVDAAAESTGPSQTSKDATVRTASTPKLIVAGDNGIREVGLDGQVARTLSRGPARHPRLFPDRRKLLYIVPANREVRGISLDTGNDFFIAQLPKRYICGDMTYAPGELDVQEDADFVIDRNGKAACLSLKNRNVNMLDIDVHLRINLTNGAVSHGIQFPDECSQGTVPKPCSEPESAPSAEVAPASASFPYDLKDGRLIRREGDGRVERVVTLVGGDFVSGLLSPSERWVTLAGNEHDGDYIHFDLLLLDRKEGQVYTVATTDPSVLPTTSFTSPWVEAHPGAKTAPSVVNRKQLGQLDKIKVHTADVVGETTMRWIGKQDVLQVGSLLVFPGEKTIELDGEIAP